MGGVPIEERETFYSIISVSLVVFNSGDVDGLYFGCSH
jgi:hypothetical protein